MTQGHRPGYAPNGVGICTRCLYRVALARLTKYRGALLCDICQRKANP